MNIKIEKFDEAIIQAYGNFFCYKDFHKSMLKWFWVIDNEITYPFNKTSTILNLNKFHKNIKPNSIE